MERINLDPLTKEQAEEYANNEAEVRGFKVGSESWKKAYKEYLQFALSTLVVGRNPRNFRYKTVTSLYPEVFSENGFAGKAAKSYFRQDGGRGIPIIEANGRILSAVMNLLKLFENGILGVKNVTTGNTQGKIANENMSELQIPNRDEFGSKEEFEAALKDVIYNWFTRDIISDCILESLFPFFTLTKNDLDEIMDRIQISEANVHEVIKEGREKLIKELRSRVKEKFHQSYRKAVLD
jgi:hypothetical protein